ncbi:HAD-IIB family hydrolase [Saccharopolyspora sp. 5N102]|uniref:HAD-IIB family hydrolase n=1 Tax=Saccharopolyspora sp. 5N102 TaxID=3375155 RepID=UPI0037B6F656
MPVGLVRMGKSWIAYIDVDGTLLDSQLNLSPGVRAAVDLVQERADIVIASGRSTAACFRIARELLEFPTYVIASNGAVVAECATGGIAYSASFPVGAAEHVLRLADSAECALWVYHATTWYVAAEHTGTVALSRSKSVPEYVDSIGERLAGAVKLMIVGAPETVRLLHRALRERQDLVSFVSYPDYLEVMPAGVSKATAARVVESLVQPRTGVRTLAIGDGVADVPLFSAVDYSVAVANSSVEVRSAAGYLAPSNDEDGVSVALRALVMGEIAARSVLRRN